MGYAWGCARSVPLTLYQAVSGGLGEGQLNPPWPHQSDLLPGAPFPVGTYLPGYAMDGRGRCNGKLWQVARWKAAKGGTLPE